MNVFSKAVTFILSSGYCFNCKGVSSSDRWLNSSGSLILNGNMKINLPPKWLPFPNVTFSFALSFLFTNDFPSVTQVWHDSCPLFLFYPIEYLGLMSSHGIVLKQVKTLLVCMFSNMWHLRESILQFLRGANLQCFILKFCCLYLEKWF